MILGQPIHRAEQVESYDGREEERTVNEKVVIAFAKELVEAAPAARAYARRLRRIAKLIEDFLEGEVDMETVMSQYDFSPAGDEYGSNNHYIKPDPFNDIEILLEFIKLAQERIADSPRDDT